jgi:hypothetical protein
MEMNFLPLVRKVIQPWETKWSFLSLLYYTRLVNLGEKKEKKMRNINIIPIKENDISRKMGYSDFLSY